MTHHRWPALLLAVALACSDSGVSTDPASPALAKLPASGPRITDLGAVGGLSSSAAGLNSPAGSRLLVVGFSDDGLGGTNRAAYWYFDLITGAKSANTLRLPPGDFRHGWGFDANRAERIAGFAYHYSGSAAETKALLWNAPGAAPAFLPGLENSPAQLAAINESGHAAGQFGSDDPTSSVLFFDGTAASSPGTLGGRAEARDVNIRDDIVGVSWPSPTAVFAESRAFVSLARGPLIQLPDLGGRSEAKAINDLGVIVGSSLNASGQSRAVRWTPLDVAGEYVIEDLGLTNAVAWDINAEGEIAGSFQTSRGARGFFRSRTGMIRELPTLSSSSAARAMNDNGQIVGYSYDRRGNSHAVLWTNVR